MGPRCWLSREHRSIITPRFVVWVPHWIRFGFVLFHGLYSLAIPGWRIDYYLCSCHRCDQVLLQVRGYLSGSHEKQNKQKNSAFKFTKFQLVKIHGHLLFLKKPVRFTSLFVTLTVTWCFDWFITNTTEQFCSIRRCTIFARHFKYSKYSTPSLSNTF